MTTSQQQQLLRWLPKVDHLLDVSGSDPFLADIPRSVCLAAIRRTIDDLRHAILEPAGNFNEIRLSEDSVLETVKTHARLRMQKKLKRTVNATGIVIHTNLGRSILAREAMDHVAEIAGGYSNLEFDLSAGRRGSRYQAVEEILCEISGAESAMVVNNNAAAVLLAIDTLARGKEAVVSRGELIEIGGSFRIPDVMARGGAALKEVGTTNKTHLADYESAVHEGTGLLLKVHTSNYRIMGFTSGVPLADLVLLGHRHGIPVMEDLGSGTFIDFSRYGMIHEPTVQESVAAGVDLVTFSGDKLLGGPQAGIILGKKELITRIKKNPLTRALRIDKMTLAALEGTARLYRDPEQAVQKIPTLRTLTLPRESVLREAERLAGMLRRIPGETVHVEIREMFSQAGGGSLPMLNIPSAGVAITVDGLSAASVERFLRNRQIPIIGRIEDECMILDARTLMEDDCLFIENAMTDLVRTLA